MPTSPFVQAERPVISNPPPASSLPIRRVTSVDVYRGFVMLLMMAEVLSLETVAKALPSNGFWQFLAYHQSHVAWTGCSLHDLIQPSFTFLVGVVLPYSLANREGKGQGFGVLLKHAIIRSLILVCLGIFLRSIYSKQTNFTFEDTLTQIGLGYTFAFLLAFCPRRVQIIALIVILAGYWLAFALYPLPGSGFDYGVAGVSPAWEHHLHGFAAHWNKNTNLAWAFDRWFLNLFPRSTPFSNNGGGYATLSFIPTLGTMILGLFAGQLLRSPAAATRKLKFLVLTGLALIAFSVVLHLAGINPIVKRIWTPAWTLFSGGICYLLLAFFYGIVDVAGKSKWSFILMVIGANSIAAYFIADGGVRAFIASSLYIHFGQHFDQVFGAAYATLVKGALVLFFEWMILYWMYRKRIFIRI